MEQGAPLHLHKTFRCGPESRIEVFLNQPAKVYLMDDLNYQNFLQWEAYSAFGGHCDQSPARLRPNLVDDWHLVIQQDEGSRHELTVRVQVVSDQPLQSPQPPTSSKNKSPQEKSGPLPGIQWELENPGSIILQVGKVRKFLTQQEMNSIIHLVLRGKNDLARCKLLYSWLERERRDILIDADMSSDASPVLREMVFSLKERFAPGIP